MTMAVSTPVGYCARNGECCDSVMTSQCVDGNDLVSTIQSWPRVGLKLGLDTVQLNG